MANKASYRVGRYLSPQPDDPALATLADAHREAAQQAAEMAKASSETERGKGAINHEA